MLNADGITDQFQTNSQASGLLITVAICMRNRANFLQRAIESVLPQMTDATELLIVDNASTDDTPEVAARITHVTPNAIPPWHATHERSNMRGGGDAPRCWQLC
jgi:hypothetical protein